MTHTIMPTLFTTSSLYSITIQTAIVLDDIEEFKRLLTSEDESLTEDERHAIAYSSCAAIADKKFLHCLIFEFHLKENLIHPGFITEEVKFLFAKRKAEELEKELSINDSKDKKVKV